MSWRQSSVARAAVKARDAVLFSPAVTRSVARHIHRNGDRVRLRGASLDVSSPLVTPWVKSLLFWGFYEKPEARLIAQYAYRASPVIELGASIGAITSQLARIVDRFIPVISVEADPRLVPIVRHNVELNGPNRVTVIHAAIDYSGQPEIGMQFGESNLAGKVGDGSVMVPTITLSQLAADHRIRDYTLVADIEGAEAAMITQDATALRGCHTAIIELHDTDAMTIGEQAEHWRSLGFALLDRRSDVFVFRRVK